MSSISRNPMNAPVSVVQQAALDTKAPLNSPALTGTPTVPTATTGTNTGQVASTAFAMTAAANAAAALVAGSPAALDTLNELAAALGNDANFAATTATALGNRLRVDVGTQALTTGQKSNALVNLGLPNVDNTHDSDKPVSTAQAAADAAVLSAATAASAPAAHVGSGGATHALATTSAAGFLGASDKVKLDAITGANTGDETTATIKAKLGITTLSGANTGDQTSVSGNAGTADRLTTPRTINGVAFDGSADINFPVGDVTLTGTQTLTNKTLTAPAVNGYTEGVATASTGAAYTINITTASVQILTLTGNCTYTFPAAVAGKSFLLVQKQDATGSRTATWPAAVKWPSGTAPTLTATANKSDVFGFTCDGTSWYGRVIGSAYA